jgi:hypothetical protein
VTEIHDAISSWYRKVFDCTGYPIAIFDAVDHLCLSAKAFIAQGGISSSADACERLNMAHSLLNTNRFLIQTTGGAINNTRRLSLIRNGLSEKRGIWSEGVADTSLVEAVIKLQLVTVVLMRSIARDVGEQGKAYEFHRELRVRKLNDRKILHFPQIRKYEPKTKETFHSLSSHVLSGQDGKKLWLNWWRWCSTLAISSRLYPQAESALSKAFWSLKTNRLEFPVKKQEFAKARDFKDIFFPQAGWDPAIAIETLRLIENWVDLSLLRDDLRIRLQLIGSEEGNSKTSQTDLKKVIYWALDLVETVRTHDSSSDAHLSARAIWCKARFLMHLGNLTLSSRTRDKNIPHAMGLLDDAHACLSSSDSSRNKAALACVELYRADVRLRQSAQATIGKSNGPFEDWCLKFLQKGVLSASRRTVLKKQIKTIVDRQLPQLRDIRTRAADAIRFLDRAEPILRERRRNVWWTTWYFERRLMAIALTVWSSVGDTKEPIPFLGLEGAVSRAETEADLLLNDAVRMIRVDTQRLAEVILAYALCVRGLEVRLAVDECAIALPNRINSMKSNLREALGELGGTESRLDTAVKSASQQSDQSVKRFVKGVKKLAKNILDKDSGS